MDQRPPQNQDLSAVTYPVQEVLTQYGWYLLAATALFYLLIQYIIKKIQSETRTANSSAPMYQDAGLVSSRQEALEASRMRMQQELDAKAALFKEKIKQNTEEDMAATVIKRKTDKKPLRSSDYNPLSGDGGGTCAWRPGRRGPSAGG